MKRDSVRRTELTVASTLFGAALWLCAGCNNLGDAVIDGLYGGISDTIAGVVTGVLTGNNAG